MRAAAEPTFSRQEYEGRLARVRAGMADRGLDTLLVHIPENIYYLTGHQTVGYYAYQCLAVPLDGAPLLCVRGLERNLSLAMSWLDPDAVWGYADTEDPVDATIAALGARGLLAGRTGIERGAWFLGLDAAARIEAAAGGLADGGGIVESCRLVKSPAEISCIRAAAGAADAAIRAAAGTVAAGAGERDVAAAMYAAGIGAGSEYASLPPFVASGPRSALGHATWSAREIAAGDVVFLEVSGTVRRYSAALMRSVVAGAPDPRQRAIEAALAAALERAIAAMVPGAPAEAVDAACRAPVEEAGFGDYFTHRAGYSIGVNFPPDWGEGHIASLRAGARFPLAAGMVFHVIPAVLVPGEYGIGMSETVLVTEHGGEPLGSLPRTLL